LACIVHALSKASGFRIDCAFSSFTWAAIYFAVTVRTTLSSPALLANAQSCLAACPACGSSDF